MPRVVGVRFAQANKVYYFDPNDGEEVQAGDCVIVDTAKGREMGTVASAPHDVPDNEIVGKLKKVVRRVEPWDMVQAEAFTVKGQEALDACKALISQENLPMKLVRAEFSFDGARLTFYFTSDKRVDFRNLVRDLAKTFKTRIELRQIGVRDEAKLIGGLGRCGRPLCCGSWLCEFSPVSIKMAKQQDLPLNPTEISGTCGRLLCCLAYENDFYVEAKSRLPKVGRTITTKEGRGRVISHNVFKDTVRVELENEAIIEVSAEDLSVRVDKPAAEPQPPAPLLPPQPQQAPQAQGGGRKKRKKKKSSASTSDTQDM